MDSVVGFASVKMTGQFCSSAYVDKKKDSIVGFASVKVTGQSCWSAGA